jgi:pyrophosphatase PpaX
MQTNPETAESRPPEWLANVRCVLFDVDGTLIDTTHLIASGLDYAIRKHTSHTPTWEELVALIGRPLVDQMGVYGTPEQVPEMSRTFMEYYFSHQELEKPFPGAIEMLEAAQKGGRKVGIVTSKNRTEVAHFLSRFPIQRYLDVVVSSEDAPRPKPHPDPVIKAMELAEVHPTETLFIGDSVYDMRAGRSSGVFVGAALWGPFGRDVLEPESPHVCFASPADVVSALAGC